LLVAALAAPSSVQAFQGQGPSSQNWLGMSGFTQVVIQYGKYINR
jgi:hypothetical protein